MELRRGEHGRNSGDCCICFQSTSSSNVAMKKKLLFYHDHCTKASRGIIKLFLLYNLLITGYSFEEPRFQTDDYICHNCINLLTKYHKAKENFED